MKELLETLGQNLSSRACVESVFGTPIVVGKRTYVPVARIQFGYGGGQQEGSPGAGGGLEATPLGLLELTEEGASFLPLSKDDRVSETVPGIYTLGPHSWMLHHQGRFALIHPPPPGAWLQHLAGPVDLVVNDQPVPLFPQAKRLISPPALWRGHLGGEPLFVLAGGQGVVFRGVLLLPEGKKSHNPRLPDGYLIHSSLP